MRVWGAGFRGQPVVKFGETPAGSVQVVSPTELRVETPGTGREGPVEVSVEVGAERAVLPDGFEYTAPFPEIELARLQGKGLVLQGSGDFRFARLTQSGMSFGDLTGDGVDDLAVGLLFHDRTRWMVNLVRGRHELPDQIPALVPSADLTVITRSVTGPRLNPVNSSSVVFLGDVNGDGMSDLGIGAVNGVGYILLGGPGLPQEVDLESPEMSGRVVFWVREGLVGHLPGPMARLGDLTGDGIDDFALAYGQASGAAGEIMFISGRRDWPRYPEQIDLEDNRYVFTRIRGSSAGQALGVDLENVGDVNGDGFPDLFTSERVTTKGRVHLIFTRSGISETVDIESLTAEGRAAGIGIQRLGPLPWLNIAGAGDVNADGLADLLVGVEGGGTRDQGLTYLIYGRRDLPPLLEVLEEPTAPDGLVRIFGEWPDQQAGNVGPAGDFNDDGYADFLVGGPGFNTQTREAGSVYLMLGGPALPEKIELVKLGGRGIRIPGAVPTMPTGTSVGPFGDLNGDGQTDFTFNELVPIAGTPPGNLYVVYGPYGDKTFIRGDANSDAQVDISDAITVLTALFLGGPFPLCEDAADSDDTGLLDLTDAVYLLSHAFQAGPAPPAPFPARGPDPTNDPLRCRRF